MTKKLMPRQLFLWWIREFTTRTVEEVDQKFGRQLATYFEKAALTLRAKFGGECLIMAPRAPRNGSARVKATPTPPTGESRTLRAYRAAYAHPAPTGEWLAETLGLKRSVGIDTIIARVRDERRKASEWPSGPQYDLLIEADGTEHRVSVWPVDLPGVQVVDTIPEQGD